MPRRLTYSAWARVSLDRSRLHRHTMCRGASASRKGIVPHNGRPRAKSSSYYGDGGLRGSVIRLRVPSRACKPEPVSRRRPHGECTRYSLRATLWHSALTIPSSWRFSLPVVRAPQCFVPAWRKSNPRAGMQGGGAQRQIFPVAEECVCEGFATSSNSRRQTRRRLDWLGAMFHGARPPRSTDLRMRHRHHWRRPPGLQTHASTV